MLQTLEDSLPKTSKALHIDCWPPDTGGKILEKQIIGEFLDIHIKHKFPVMLDLNPGQRSPHYLEIMTLNSQINILESNVKKMYWKNSETSHMNIDARIF